VVIVPGGGADGRIGASSVLLELDGCQGLDRILHFVLGSFLHFSGPCCIFSYLEGLSVKVCNTNDEYKQLLGTSGPSRSKKEEVRNDMWQHV
jgi:hypothetical protein